MVEVFYTLIKNGLRTIDEVPEKIKVAVQTLLDKENV